MIRIPLEPFYGWLLVFVRTGFILGLFPLIGERFIPVRIRLIMVMAVAAAIAPTVTIPTALPSTGIGYIMLILAEALLGISVALIGRILFAVIQYAGQIAGEQMGFGMINAINPESHQISIVAETQYLLAVLIFLVSDLHHVIIAAIAHSYELVPAGGAIASEGLTRLMMGMGGMLFSLSVQLAMPVIVIVFAINVGLGMIARAVPQVNVFMESFPLRIVAGLSILLISLGFTMAVWQDAMGRMGNIIQHALELM